MKQPTDEVRSIYEKLCDLKSKSKTIAVDIEILENQLKTFIGESEGIEGIATWKDHVRKSFDHESLKLEHPEIFVKFCKEKKYKIFRLLNKQFIKDDPEF